jgi:hypothetical protein
MPQVDVQDVRESARIRGNNEHGDALTKRSIETG